MNSEIQDFKNSNNRIMSPKEIISDRLAEVINNAGSYKEVSQKTNISPSTLFRIVNKKTDPKFTDVLKIIQATNADFNYVVYGIRTPMHFALTEYKARGHELFNEVMEKLVESLDNNELHPIVSAFFDPEMVEALQDVLVDRVHEKIRQKIVLGSLCEPKTQNTLK